MGVASRIVSVVLRLCELIAAAVVAGIVGGYLHHVSVGHGAAGSRMVYAVAIAGISIVLALVCMPPLKYSFYFFVVDFALFICWMVVAGLLVALTGTNACTSGWYWQNWGYYYGGYYTRFPYLGVPQSIVGTADCGKWRATIAWSFIGGFCWFVSGVLGVYVCSSMRYNKKSSAVKGNQQVGEVPNDFHGNRTANDMTVPYSTTKAPQAPLTSSDVV